MANFSKEEVVQFEKILEGWDSAATISMSVNKYQTDMTQMARTGDVIWRPQPYILPSFDGTPGTDISANYMTQMTQMAVPVTLNSSRVVPFVLTQKELRDMLQEDRLASAARTRLTTDIEDSIRNIVTLQGAQVIKRTVAATGYDDIAVADSLFNEIGVAPEDRVHLLASRDYNSMASNLAARQTMNQKPTTAYERNYVGMVAGFETMKLSTANRLTAAAGVGVTINGANQRYIPKNIDANGNNVDNRYQPLNITVTSGTVKVGDAFTIANVNRVHMWNKQDTGQLQTFRIVSITSGGGGTGTVVITPPIIAADSAPTLAETQYKNVTATPANGAVITFLNTVSAYANPFYHKSAVEIIPGRYATPQGGVDVMSATTDSGFQVTMTKQFNIANYQTVYRFDTFYGTAVLNPSMAGITLFNQT